MVLNGDQLFDWKCWVLTLVVYRKAVVVVYLYSSDLFVTVGVENQLTSILAFMGSSVASCCFQHAENVTKKTRNNLHYIIDGHLNVITLGICSVVDIQYHRPYRIISTYISRIKSLVFTVIQFDFSLSI